MRVSSRSTLSKLIATVLGYDALKWYFLYSSRGASWTGAGRWIPAGDNGYPDGLPVLPGLV